jgi:rhodanese-related sulfurtransferase
MVNVIPPRRASRVPHVKLALGFTALIVCALALLPLRSFDWFLVKRSLRNKFGAQNWITSGELAAWLADKKRKSPVLLDVRTAAEWNVSHLPGARRVEPKTSAAAAAAGAPKDAPIVTYCAVGYRSGEMAERLRAAGYSQVGNLDGSIFQWANEHRPLVHDGVRVQRVHPYNAFWGYLLADDVRAPLPAQ